MKREDSMGSSLKVSPVPQFMTTALPSLRRTQAQHYSVEAVVASPEPAALPISCDGFPNFFRARSTAWPMKCSVTLSVGVSANCLSARSERLKSVEIPCGEMRIFVPSQSNEGFS
jgi:hypothetical protein